MLRLSMPALLLALAGCATKPPANPDNLCEIFREKPKWHEAALKMQQRWGAPVQVPMAMMYQESSFKHDALPPRYYFLGFIPWGRVSSAYGYAQAKDETWADYKREAGGWGASRDDFADAALHVQEHFGDQAQLLILPADHLIRDEQAFAAAVAEARGLAAQGYLVTFGITPERAETGFGYIEQGAPLGNGFRVARFVEKPDQATAQSYLDSGKYLWNAGMFCFQAATVLQELERHAPEVLIAARAALADGSSLENGQCRQRELAAGAFAEAPDISVDYALMERSDKVAVVPCSIGWSDIGSWQALRELSAADENGNQVRGESVLHDVSNCYIDSPKRLVGAVGVHDLIIVDTPDALLVADAARSQDVKFVAQELKRRGHDAFRLHRTVSRPWGTYTVLEEGRRFKIKRIVVRPKASLSLQMHHHRSEHWIVVSGMALVENGEREFLLNTNESTFIPAGHSHRLSNPGIIDLVMIEVQSGEYLGEDDIVRFNDIYGRAPASDEKKA